MTELNPRNKSIQKPSPSLDFSVNEPVNSLYCFSELEIGFLLFTTQSIQNYVTVSWRDMGKLSSQLSPSFSWSCLYPAIIN